MLPYRALEQETSPSFLPLSLSVLSSFTGPRRLSQYDAVIGNFPETFRRFSANLVTLLWEAYGPEVLICGVRSNVDIATIQAWRTL